MDDFTSADFLDPFSRSYKKIELFPWEIEYFEKHRDTLIELLKASHALLTDTLILSISYLLAENINIFWQKRSTADFLWAEKVKISRKVLESE